MSLLCTVCFSSYYFTLSVLTDSDKYNDSTGKYDQTVSLNGSVVSSLSTDDGQAQGWGTAVECQDSACKSSVPAHSKIQYTLTF